MSLDTVIYRLNYAFSLKQAKQWTNRSFFNVNYKNVGWHSYHVQIGDIVMPNDFLRSFNYESRRQTTWLFDLGSNYMNLRLFFRQIQIDQYPSHFMINDRVPAALVIAWPNPYQIRHSKSFSAQFITLSMGKYS